MSNPSKRTLFVVTFVAVAVVGGVAAYVKFAPATHAPIEEPNGGTILTRGKGPDVSITHGQPEHSEQKVLVFHASYEGENLKFDSLERDVPVGEDPKVFAVNEFLKDSKIVDEGARLLAVHMQGDEAHLSFNEAFNTSYGTDDEHTLLDGLRTTLGQFPEVKKVLLEADGKPIESLGNVEITDGLPVLHASTNEPASHPPKAH